MHHRAVGVGSGEGLGFAAGPGGDLEGGGLVLGFVFEGDPGKRRFAGGAGASLGDGTLSPLRCLGREIGPGDGMRDDGGCAGHRLCQHALEPFGGVGFLK